METDVLLLSTSRLMVVRHIPSKRLFDIFFSFCMLILLSPLFLFIILAIRLSSPGPAIFKQPRLGRGGTTFTCFKFRTMYLDAEARLKEILENNPELKQEWEKKQKLKADPRIVPGLGKFLRKTSLDELPQFWNVLKGDMSIVGPRPYLMSQKNDFGWHAYKIFSVRPGITGVWQTAGRSHICFQKHVEIDAKYVQERSFWFDLYLVIKTIPVVLFPKDDAY